LSAFAIILAIAIAAAWPALINGGPFWMQDTPSYLRASASGLYKFLDIKSAWANEYLRLYSAQAREGAAAPSTKAQIPVTLSGRSIYYGAFLLLSELAGSLWIAVAVQCLLAATAIVLTVNTITRSVGRKPKFEALPVGIFVVIATPLGFFTSYLMPDIFGGFALLATASLLFLRPYLSRTGANFWISLLAYSLLVHTANIPLTAGMAVVALVYACARKQILPRDSVASIGACIIGAILAQAIFAHVVRASTGAAPVRPPFLAMRLIADGPGYAYLRTHCSKEQYIYCRTVAPGPRPSDTLLWSADPNVSLFRGLPPDQQRESAKQQLRFATSVLAATPGQVIRDSGINAARQLVEFRLDGFNYNPGMVQRFRESVPDSRMISITNERAFRQTMPTRVPQGLAAVTAAVALLFMILSVALSRLTADRRSIEGFFVTILAGFAVNAIVCGAISGPKGRYEMRLIWVLPLVAGSTGLGLLRVRQDRRSSDRHEPERAKAPLGSQD
jgi:hypothetical protein